MPNPDWKYAQVYKGTVAHTPGGLTKSDIKRIAIKGPRDAPRRYRYVSRARSDAAKARGLPQEMKDEKIEKIHYHAAGTRHKRKSSRRMR